MRAPFRYRRPRAIRQSINYDRMAENCVLAKQDEFDRQLDVFDAFIVFGLTLAALGCPLIFLALLFWLV